MELANGHTLETGASGVIGELRVVLERLNSVDLAPADLIEAEGLLQGMLAGVGALDAQVARLVAEVHDTGLWRNDGFRTVRDWLKHAGRLSGSEAFGYATVAVAADAVPAATEAHRRGELGCAQARVIATIAANPRVADALADGHKLLVEDAERFDYEDFLLLARKFVLVADPDDASDGDRRHASRNARIDKDFDGGWKLSANCSDLDGAQLHEILTRFIEAEVLADWATAREACGDEVAAKDLPRTPAQRRFDALRTIFRAAAGAPPDGIDPDPVVCVVVDEQTLTDEIQRRFGDTPPEPRNVADYRSMRCETLDGDPITPADALAAALTGQLRRVVYDQASVVINLGTAARYFRGNAGLAARLARSHCYWPGCRVRSSRAQIDHLIDHERNGPTDQNNAGPGCGHHHRFRHKHRYRPRRLPDGRWIITRPDGTQLE